jgi:hypothetical protein
MVINMGKQLQILIKADGAVQIVDVAGVGQGCQALTHDLEKVLGKADENTRHTTGNFYKVENDVTVDQSL